MSETRRAVAPGGPFAPGEVAVSGEVQFWRMAPERWRPALEAVRDVGVDHVATYLSWRRHEPAQGVLDFTDPAHDVRRFLTLCAELGLSVHLKPGPWICAEEPGGGLPDWVMAREDLLALDHAGRPVIGYNPPFRHPVPSYASTAYRDLVRGWFGAVWDVVGPFAQPGGPVVAVQLDNEPSAAFQDAMFGVDYHPEAVASFRRFVLERHGDLESVAHAWGQDLRRVADIEPPRPGRRLVLGARERDWVAHHEHAIGSYLAVLHGMLVDLGAGALVATVNLNTHPVRGMPQSGTAIVHELRSARPDATVVVGEDHYVEPPLDDADLGQLELAAAQGAASGTDLVWAPELQAGIWRSPGEVVTYPDPLPGELAAWWGLALAYGYQGFNLYMLVCRENWALSPLDVDGRRGPAADDLARLLLTMRAVPGLRDHRPVPAANLVWDRTVRETAYLHLGTMAEPTTPWTDPAAVAPWQETMALAVALTRAGVPYRLCETPDRLDPMLPTVGPAGLPPVWDGVELTAVDDVPGPVRADDDGVAARVLRAPVGSEVLVVVSWRRGRDDRAVTLTWGRGRQDGRGGALVDVSDGTRTPVADGRATLEVPALGVRVLRYVAG